MPDQIDWTEEGGEAKPQRGRKKKGVEPRGVERAPADREGDEGDEAAGSRVSSQSGGAVVSASLTAHPGEAPASEGSTLTTAQDFGDVAHLTKKGLRVISVVTGAVVDQAGNFLFYVDGHEDARSGVQAQINHQLGAGPAKEEYLAPVRSRVRELLEKLSKPR